MPEISAKIRKEAGKGLNALRKEGVLPSVLYGEGVPSTSLMVQRRDFEKVLKAAGETSLVTLKLEDGKVFNVLIQDVSKDPLSLEPIHADFHAVRMDKPIEAKVPLSFIGESPAVKNDGGILVKVLHEIEVKALPKDIPHEIEVDAAKLETIGSRLHVSDLAIPAGVTLKIHPEDVVALVEAPRSDAELEALAEKPAEAATTEVKTEREVKAEAKAAEATEDEAAGGAA